MMALTSNGMMVKELCEKVPISYNSLWNIRKGKSEPRPATIGKIAKALNVSVSDLIEDAGQ